MTSIDGCACSMENARDNMMETYRTAILILRLLWENGSNNQVKLTSGTKVTIDPGCQYGVICMSILAYLLFAAQTTSDLHDTTAQHPTQNCQQFSQLHGRWFLLSLVLRR
jgi:hypothetical protein